RWPTLCGVDWREIRRKPLHAASPSGRLPAHHRSGMGRVRSRHGGVARTSEERIGITYIETSLAAQAGRSVKLIEGTIEPTAVEATVPSALEPPKPKSRLMLAADAAVRPRVRKPRQRKMPSPASA